MKIFNTAGPNNIDDHYTLSPLHRFDLDHILFLIAQKKYFILHAPRQTGKTSSMLALMDYLNEQGDYRALYFNVESGQAARENVHNGVRAILGELANRAYEFLDDPFLLDHMKEFLDQFGAEHALNIALSRWAMDSPKPLVLMIDEIDSLVGDTLIAVLRQLRAGYDKRPKRFPQTLILCGVRDVRDYRLHSTQEKAVITGGSAFNIKAESLRLGNFKQHEVTDLLTQHTTETGQRFEPEAINLIWQLTQGQPWLVNALAYEVCFKDRAARERTSPITAELIQEAKEQLILRRETHLDQLVHKLSEERVRNVIEPILAGQVETERIPVDDISYVRDLGLLRAESKQLEIANPIYREVIPRELTYSSQLTITHDSTWYVRPEDGQLDMEQLLTAFQQFFRQNSEHWLKRFAYQEAGPQLLLQAFLQRIVNGGGRIEREYGLGRKRTDLLIIWPYEGGVQQVVLELKIRRGDLEALIKDGLTQTWAYMDRCGTTDGHLIIFDRSPDRSWEKKIFRREESHQGHPIPVWGM